MKLKNRIIVLLITLLVVSCAKTEDKNTRFVRVSAKDSGINFNNKISTDNTVNILNYEYLYNGGGVGVGYFNNDSLPDLFFTGNLTPSKIYINKGNFTFQDITLKSKINTKNKWCTGVSVIDINQDGLDDIYISVGGMGNKNEFPNVLYINNGDSTFTESAKKYGLDDHGESIQSVFFDYDLDGDLDMYLLTGGGFENSAINVRPMLTDGRSRNTDRLYRNDFDKNLGHPYFTNVSKTAGIRFEGFGLGVSVIDANNDDWPDLYISNDYLSRDLLYVNQKNGSFLEKAQEYFGHTSHFSMGNDVADIDNDGYFDVITMDMLPENVKRRKLMSGAQGYDIFQIALRYGYGHQHMRNMLHKNNGNNTFSEIGQLAGIDKTDWSWAPLLADFDNDGLNDLFITNGFGKDITDMDFVKFRENKASTLTDIVDLKKSIIDCLYQRPAIKVANYAYKNNGQLKFTKVTEDWGFGEASISNGAAYVDLDLDGDLDLVVNNINDEAFVFKNKTNSQDKITANFLKVNLIGDKLNKKGFGATVAIYANDKAQKKYNQPIRGFQSAVDSKIHFGLDSIKKIDSLIVKWPNGYLTKKYNLGVNTLVDISYQDAKENNGVNVNDKHETLFTKDSTLTFKHSERYYNDYATQLLLMHGNSNNGPGLAVGDLNNDGLDDVFMGNGYGALSTILYQSKSGGFNAVDLPNTEIFEDQAAIIFDANNDGLNDIYITSGGSERYANHKAYQDRIYYNKNGSFEQGELPTMLSSTSTVVGGDFDNDGDIDLFVGGKLVPGKYPTTPKSYLLQNDNGTFIDVTNNVCPLLNEIGMVSSAVFTDYNNDNYLDLIVVGEFMPITILQGDGKSFNVINTDNSGLNHSTGLWNSVQPADFDNDGDIDFILGNLGLNSNIKSFENHPFKVDYADFDNNSFVDPIFSKYEEGHYYPLANLDQLTQQLPKIKKKFMYYNTFAKSTTNDILAMLNTSYKTLKAEILTTSYVENLGNNKFAITALPIETQLAPVNGILTEDINADGYLDVILVGNNYNTEVSTGRYDASIGTVLLNHGNSSFEALNTKESGFSVNGNAKSIVKIVVNDRSQIAIGKNNDVASSFHLNRFSKSIKPKADEASAIIKFTDGKTRKDEFYLGSGYMSQSSKSISLNNKIESITFYNFQGKITRVLNFEIQDRD